MVDVSGSTTNSNRRFLWCGPEICEQRDSSGATVTKQFFDQGVRDSSTNYFYNRDHLGSIREVMASNGTTIEARYDYDPYGRRTKVSGSYDADFGYTGHFHEQPSWMTTGLNLTWFRAYDPELGRWLSRDPMEDAILLPQGSNLYRYVANNPVSMTDPFGLFQVPIPGSTALDIVVAGDNLFKNTGKLASALDIMMYYNADANRHVGVDRRFFHCMAGCRAKDKIGPKLTDAILRMKEIWDNLKTQITCDQDFIRRAEDSFGDMEANRHGFTAPDGMSCRERCVRYWPGGRY
jgi:RHS repeat-associated protein